MSNKNQETIAYIVKEMRGNAEHNHALGEVSKYLNEIADRIEAAANRELKSTIEKSSAVGNVAKMREALLEASIALSSATHHHLTEDDAKDCLAVIESALSAPPRKCDVLSVKQEALSAIHEDRCYVNNPIDERRLTVEWLYAEAKGE